MPGGEGLTPELSKLHVLLRLENRSTAKFPGSELIHHCLPEVVQSEIKEVWEDTGLDRVLQVSPVLPAFSLPICTPDISL